VLVRRLKRRDAWLKRLLARLFYAVISLLFHIDYDYRVGNFRMLTRRAVEYFRQHRERMRNVNAIMALMGLRTVYVDVTHRARRHGKSTYTLGRSARMAAQAPSSSISASFIQSSLVWCWMMNSHSLGSAERGCCAFRIASRRRYSP